MDSIVERAKDLAHRAHAGQVDKAGRPYIEHVARVAAAVRNDRLCSREDCNGRGEIVDWDSVGCSDPSCCSPATYPCPDCDVAEAIAWLHDVFEDCATEYSSEVIREMPSSVSCAIADLTRSNSETPDIYYQRIKHNRSNGLTLRVKLADIADNADESRLALLDDKTAERLRRKYAKAQKALGG